MITPQIIHDPSKRIYATTDHIERNKYIRICLLDFLNAPNLFVSEFGIIWNRSEFNNTKNNDIFFRNYLPMVVRDKYRQVPWVYLPTAENKSIWYPIDLIVGWAFKPTTDATLKYFDYDYTGILNVIHCEYLHNSNKLDLPEESKYRQLLESIYL